MRKAITSDPSEDMLHKIRNARLAIMSKSKRDIKCPYCQHTAFVVFADATGFVETKCKKCKQEVIVDLVSMRRIRQYKVTI